MKKLLFVSTLTLFAFSFVNAQNWQLDFEQAKKMAAEQNRNIVLVFQGSDWCAPCIKLNRDVWSTEEFKKYSNENFVLLLADFPRRKKHRLSEEQQNKNKKLAEKYNINGYFPFVVVLNKDGEVLGTTGYKKVSASEFIKILAAF